MENKLSTKIARLKARMERQRQMGSSDTDVEPNEEIVGDGKTYRLDTDRVVLRAQDRRDARYVRKTNHTGRRLHVQRQDAQYIADAQAGVLTGEIQVAPAVLRNVQRALLRRLWAQAEEAHPLPKDDVAGYERAVRAQITYVHTELEKLGLTHLLEEVAA